MEAYTYSDPTRAEDGLFLNPSETLILNSGVPGLDEDGLPTFAFGFAPGEDLFGDASSYSYGDPLKGNAPDGAQQSSEQTPRDDIFEPDGQTQSVDIQTGEGTSFDLEAVLQAAFDELLEEQLQANDNQDQNVEAYIHQSPNEHPPADIHHDQIPEAHLQHAPKQCLGEQPPAVENQIPNLEADLEGAFDEFLPLEASQGVEDDDDLDSLFTPETDDEEDDLSSSSSPQTRAISKEKNTATKALPSVAPVYPSWVASLPKAVPTVTPGLPSWVASLPKVVPSMTLALPSVAPVSPSWVASPPEVVSSVTPVLPSWMASLPTLPKPIESNGPPALTQTAWQPTHVNQPAVVQSNVPMTTTNLVQSTFFRPESTLKNPQGTPCQHLPPPSQLPLLSAASYPSLSAPNSTSPPLIQLGLPEIPPCVPDDHQPARFRLPLTHDSFFRPSQADSEPFKRTFTPDVPIEPPQKKQRIINLPRSSEVPGFFQMEKSTFRDFEKEAKAFMINGKHPQRYADGSGNVQIYRKETLPSLSAFNKYPAQFLDEGAGEMYFGVNSEGYATRTLKWPEHKDTIAEMVLPLFRKICKNEDQRLYANRNRITKANSVPSEKAAKVDKRRRKQSVVSSSDIAQSLISGSSSPSAQSPAHSNPSQNSTETSSPGSSLDQSFGQVPIPSMNAESTCANQAVTQAQVPPMVGATSNQSVVHSSAPAGNGLGAQNFVFHYIPFSLPALQFSINFVLDDSRYVIVRSGITLDVGVHPSYPSMLEFIHETIPKDYYLCSLSVLGPSILRQIQIEDVWNAAVMEIYQVAWMGREVKCVAGLAKLTTATRTTGRKVIVID